MSTTLQVPDGDMVLDLSPAVNGVEGYTDDGYIDYSEDEPEPSPMKVANNPSNSDAGLSAGDATDFAQQVLSSEPQSTAVSTKRELEVANNSAVESSTNGDIVLDETSALADSASTPTPLIVETKEEHSGEDVITWEEEELKSIEREEETNIEQNLPSNDDQGDIQAPEQPSPTSETVRDADENDGAVHASAREVEGGLAHDAEAVPDASATTPSSQQGDGKQHEIDYEEAAPEAAESEKEEEHDGLDDVSQSGENHDTVEDKGNEGRMPVENASDSGEREYGDESMQEFGEAGDGLEIYPAENQEDDADVQFGESSAASLHTPEDGSVEVPAITVAWDGDEYPLFYNSPGSEDRECFFDDLGLLQCKMEELLVSFRRELSNDVSDVDELVFQVDELGLEFAETSRPEEYSEITLGGILQIFDTLVKNKDPEASRPLYCYLLTRPRTSKRWHALIEDAYQGKSIDEVFFSFHDQGHDSGGVDTPGEDPGMALMQVDDEAEDIVDEVENESEDVVEQHEGDDGQVDTSYGLDLALEQAFDDAKSNDEEVAGEELEAVDAAETGASELADDKAPTAVSRSDDLATAPVPEADAANSSVEQDEDVSEPAPAHEVPEVEHSPHAFDAQTEDATYDREQPVAPANDENTTVEPAATEPGADSTSKVTPASSDTATLKGDDEEEFEADIDLNADMARDDVPDQQSPSSREAHQDELEEIDWRDYPGQGDDEETNHDTASVTGKRPRSEEDDTLGEEDEQDVKRQRS